jgi:hypothetical protein
MGARDGAPLRSASGVDFAGRAAPSAVVIPFRGPLSAFPELDPLRDRFSAAALAHAERRASALGVGADRVLVAAGHIAEDDYLHAYARMSGFAFDSLDHIPRTACPLDDDGLLDAATKGILPLVVNGETIHVVAPRGIATRRLLLLERSNPKLRRQLRVTSTWRLNRFVLRNCGTAWGTRAADALRTATPQLSAASTHWAIPKWCWAVIAALIAATIVSAPEAVLAVVYVSFSFLFLAWMALRLLGVCVRHTKGRRSPSLADADLPVYTVMAAIYGEAASVADLVKSIRQIDWPPEKLDVKLVVEADDVETRAAIARLDLGPCFEVIVAPPAGPRTKPKALNAALPFARGTFTVIYDAEDRPEPNQLRAALDAFLSHDRRLVCVQAALTIDNTADGWLARMFTAEYAAHFDVLLPSLAALRLPLPLGGSSNHFRGIR